MLCFPFRRLTPKESVRTKQKIRAQVLQEIGNDGNVIVSKEQWENYQFQNEVLKEWKKTNPEDSKSLIDYGNGYKAKQKK